MAGDEDANTLSHPDKMRPLLSLAKRVSVYFAPRDVLMSVSRFGNSASPSGSPDRATFLRPITSAEQSPR